MLDGIICVIGACFGCFIGAWLFYFTFHIFNNRRFKK